MNTTPMKTVSGALRHRMPVLLAVLGLSVLAGVAAVVLLPRTYQADAQLLVDARWAGAQDPDAALRASDTLAHLFIAKATGRPLLQRASTQSGVNSTVDELVKHVSSGTVRGTTIIYVRASAASGDQAATIANAVAQALVDDNRADVTNRFASSKSYLQQELTRLDSAIAVVQAERPPANSPAAGDRAARLGLLQNEYASAYSQLQDVTLGEQRGIATLTISALAGVPSQPASPDPIRYLLAALAAGLILGVAAALIVERFDDRIYTPEGLAVATGSPVVVAIRRAKDPDSSAAQSYALAHASLMARYPGARLVMLAPASGRDRTDIPASQLGEAVAHQGQRVLIIRGDADRLGLPNVASVNGSSVTTVPLPVNHEALQELRAIASGNGPYDFAVLSVDSLDRSATALSLANTAKLAMMVATVRDTRFSEAQRTAETLKQAGIEVAASILVGKAAASIREGAAPRT
jgi:capsular polysaccharide biosynthesis protein